MAYKRFSVIINKPFEEDLVSNYRGPIQIKLPSCHIDRFWNDRKKWIYRFEKCNFTLKKLIFVIENQEELEQEGGSLYYLYHYLEIHVIKNRSTIITSGILVNFLGNRLVPSFYKDFDDEPLHILIDPMVRPGIPFNNDIKLTPILVI